MRTRSDYGGLDRFRIIAALLVTAIHTSPLTSINEGADFFLTRVLARIAVPFFFMVTGQFVVSGFWFNDGRPAVNPWKFLRRLSLLYLFCILLYLPAGIYAGHYRELTFGAALRMLVFDGTFYHLWYFPACILGVLLVYLMSRFLSPGSVTAISAILYLMGLLGDSYYGLVQKIPALEDIYGLGFRLFSYTRNGIFLAPLFLVLGAWMSPNMKGTDRGGKTDSFPFCTAAFLLSFAAMTAEAFTLRHFAFQRHDSMYLALVPAALFLYRSLLYLHAKPSKILRTAAMWIYILHPAFIIVVRGIAKPLHLTGLLVDNSLLHYLAVCLSSAAAGFVLAYLQEKLGQHFMTSSGTAASGSAHTSRAWVEVDASALEHNVAFLRSLLPDKCRLMPAVKAEAYGHGAVLVARQLNLLGIDAFSVACASEGVALRKAGVRGTLLILGYTSPEDFPLLARYRLTQTVVDYPYARALNQWGQTVHVHIGIDTGMHRLGIRCENVEEVEAVYRMENLKIDGLFTHLSASDSDQPEDIAFTDSQITAFYQLVDILQKDGFPCPGLHLLASYGILNLLRDRESAEDLRQAGGDSALSREKIGADYVRPGIALYGILSTEEDSSPWRDKLLPVLSLKARVASVRTLYAGEAAGYGLAFTAAEDTQIAAITIGYADGLPRDLSCENGNVLINGCTAPIIGRICMDQTIVNVSGIPDVRPGDTAVIIGRSGPLEITAGQIAAQCGTITNEILSRLGSRLDKILV